MVKYCTNSQKSVNNIRLVKYCTNSQQSVNNIKMDKYCENSHKSVNNIKTVNIYFSACAQLDELYIN